MMTFFCILNIDECAKECLTQRVVSKWFEEVYAFKYNLILFKYRLLNGPYNNIYYILLLSLLYQTPQNIKNLLDSR